MRHSAKSLIGYALLAKNGELGGEVEEFYFDDQQWTIRYLVVSIGQWFSKRKVLIPPVALGNPDWESRTLPVRLTMDQVRNSPDIDAEKPISRQHETASHNYLAWPACWPGEPWMAGAYGIPPVSLPWIALSRNEERVASAPRRQGDPHLRSTRAVAGYQVQARDGEIGCVKDFIIDDTQWAIRYLVVKARHWLLAKRVLVRPVWVTRVSWKDSKVFTALARESLTTSPGWTP